MGTVELINDEIIITSHIILYGTAANDALAMQVADEIQTMWNAPLARVWAGGKLRLVRFVITAEVKNNIEPEEVLANDNPVNNYFRIADTALTHISFVDGLGSNTGYFLAENVKPGSTTAAHEYGHTLGLDHPEDLDIRGQGAPGIMYPRGTLVDARYQWDPEAIAGEKGGTMNPAFRKVREQDIVLLRLDRLSFYNNKSVIGGFSSVWHDDHALQQ